MSQPFGFINFMKKRMLALRYALAVPMVCISGATALEYAIVLPILLLLLMGIIEYSLIMYGTSVLQGAISIAARTGKTGLYQNSDPNNAQQDITSIVQSRISGLMDTSQLTVTAEAFPDFASIGPKESCVNPNSTYCPLPGTFIDSNGDGVWDRIGGTKGVGGAEQVVIYTATYPWPVAVPFLQNILGGKNPDGSNSGVFTISSVTMVRNEPFATPPPTTPPTPFQTPAPTSPSPASPAFTPQPTQPGTPAPASTPAPAPPSCPPFC